jgi:glycosyltransferase involved in cell wall biosynthesis
LAARKVSSAIVKTKVSVVVPAYNAEVWLRDALDSAVAQTYAAHEIIVVDDGSKDRTEEIVRSFGGNVRYIKQANQGVSTARNTAIREATGDWIAFLDSDDLFVSEKLKRMVSVIEANPELMVVYSAFEYLYPDGTKQLIPVFPAREIWPGLRYRTPILPSAAMVRRSAFNEVGGFDKQYHYGEDWELWLRLVRRYGAKAFQDIPESLTLYRYWENNVTKNFKKTAAASLHMLDKVLLTDLSGVKREIWRRRIEARIYYQIAISYRGLQSERHWEYAVESFLKWPFWGRVVPAYRYKVFALMLYNRLRNFRWSFRYWWPKRRCREGFESK